MKLFFSYVITILALVIFIQPAHTTVSKQVAVKKEIAFKKRVAVKPSFKSSLTKKDRRCLALNIYWESRNENMDGQIAIGYVTINRLLSYKYPSTICKVVWEKRRNRKTKKLVPMFSWTMDGKLDDPKDKLAWATSKSVADYILKYYSKENDPTHGALNYHANYVKPVWRNIFSQRKYIGTHIFYWNE